MVSDIIPKNFVLVHGAWHGGWCWERVAAILQSRGHCVTTPTQTGLGERSHLLSETITPSVFIDDIVNHLKWENLTNVILVGHSFGGLTITGVADAVPERIAKLIYLDAAIIENGEAAFDLLPKEIVVVRLNAANETSGGLAMPAPSAESFGLSDPADVAFVQSRLTPHPVATFRNTVTLNNSVYEPLTVFHQRAGAAGWPRFELATGHDAMVTEPLATADMFEEHSD